jgi:hypothetical protein
MHVDGGSAFSNTLPHLNAIKAEGIAVKLTKIRKSLAGPQRATHPETYSVHTPSHQGEETFDCFATIELRDRTDATMRLRRHLPSLLESEGTVVEVERVVAVTEGEGAWQSVVELENPITLEEVGLARSRSLPIEIHHGFDLPKLTETMSIDEVLDGVSKLGISVGGWFVFDKPDYLCYRSNAFTARPNYLAKAVRQHELVTGFLRSQGQSCALWTTVEQILGIWNHSGVSSRH